jgi:3-keto-disaccharide hydrolase
MRRFFLLATMLLAWPVRAVEHPFDFSQYPTDQTPTGFLSTVAGSGKPGDWKVILDEVAPAMAPLTAQAPSVTKRPVLAQLARDPRDDHFPLLIFNGQSYGDFKLTSRFKIVGGGFEQSAGIVFRFQNPSNFYAVIASAMGSTFQCFKMDGGILRPPLGPQMEIQKGVWHELTVQCEGTRILCALDGNEAIKLIDNASAGQQGKVGFWTRGDSVSYFADTKIHYASQEILAQTLVRSALKEYPRVVGLKIFAVREPGQQPAIVASKDEKEIGHAGGKIEADAIHYGRSDYRRDKQNAYVTAPLRDRNGDPIAAVHVALKSFPGQTEDNAVVRAAPIIKGMQARAQSLEELLR